MIRFGAVLLDVVVGIKTAVERQNAHMQSLVEQHLDGAFRGVGAGHIRVEVHDHGVGVTMDGAHLRIGERGAATGDHFLQARGIHSDHIHVAFDQHNAIGPAHPIARPVQVIQH